MPIIRRSDCVPLPIVDCPVVAVVMLESRVARLVHCVENVACTAGNILHTGCLSVVNCASCSLQLPQTICYQVEYITRQLVP